MLPRDGKSMESIGSICVHFTGDQPGTNVWLVPVGFVADYPSASDGPVILLIDSCLRGWYQLPYYLIEVAQFLYHSPADKTKWEDVTCVLIPVLLLE